MAMEFLQRPPRPFLSRPPSSSRSLFLSFPLLLLSLLSSVQFVDSSVSPSNSSIQFTHQFHIGGSQVELPRNSHIVPLTRSLVSLDNSQLRGYKRSGTLVQVQPSNSVKLKESDIAFVSCDSTAYTGLLDADATLHNVFSKKPSAVLLYSTVASHCNYTDDQTDYTDIFTLLNAGIARRVEEQLKTNQSGSLDIVPDMSAIGNVNPTGGDGGAGGSTDSPNTAMIILYSITGIITALFLSIIITGAIRAHRHPERYGPRQRPGRPRQSRARGIARAMLETIPIVKYGDENKDGKVDGDKGDVEMTAESEAPASQLREDTRQPATGGTTSPTSETPRDPTTTNESKERPTATTETDAIDHPNFSCPICTDDFVKGQDLRVLPCNHQFHPECIDPWLVNVSGTCPLCRIDLNPAKPENENGNGNGNENENENQNQEGESRPEGQDDSTNNANNSTTPQQPVEETPTHRNRLSSYLHGTLNARRMRDASVEERLAALRSVREEANRDAANGNDTDDRRRNRLTARFREKFRIRTRAHGDEAAASSS